MAVKLSLAQEYTGYLDYAIIGIHRQCYENEGRQKNTANVIECMKDAKVYFVSHPDDDHTPLDYEQLVQAAKKYHVALEINNSSLVKKGYRLNCYENYRIMLNLCKQYRVPVIVNSDAHDPAWVVKFELACGLLKELKVDDELILNNSVEKVKEFIEMI